MPTLYPENTQYSSTQPTVPRISLGSPELSKQLAEYKKKKMASIPAPSMDINAIPSVDINDVLLKIQQKMAARQAATQPQQTISERAGETRQYPLGEPITPSQGRGTTPIPADYLTEPPTTYGKWVAPTTAAKMATLSKTLGGGQYIVDPSQPGALIKSQRDALTDPNKFAALSPEEQALITQNKYLMTGGNRNVQIDHIIPLWAGGANTLENMQPLRVDQHAEKTRIQAIPYTLYQSGKISLGQAKVMAQRWNEISENYNTDKIPEPFIQTDKKTGELVGAIDINMAQKFADEWGRVKPTTLKDVLKEIPETRKAFGVGVAGFANKMPSFLSGIVKGFTTEATMGIIPQVEAPKNTSEQIGNVVGSVAGWLIPFAAAAKIVTKVGTKFGIKALMPLTGEVKGTAIPFRNPKTFEVNMLDGSKKILAQHIVRNATGLAAYGQFRATVPTFLGDEDPGMERRVKQLITDSVLGGMVGRYSQSFKDYSKLGAATLALGLMEQGTEEHPDVGAVFTNAITMMALHKISGAGKQKITINKEKLAEEMNHQADLVTSHFRSNLLSSRPGENPYLEYVKKNESLPYNLRETKNIGDENIRMKKIVAEQLKSGLIDEETAMILNQKINTSSRQLIKGNMVKEVREKVDTQDISSIAEYVKGKDQTFRYSDPPEIYTLINNMPKENKAALFSEEAARPEGGVRLWISGVAEDIDPVTAGNDRIFLKGLDDKTASHTGFMIERSNFEPIQREINKTYTPEDINSRKHAIDEQPWNHAQLYGVMAGEEGGVHIIPLGYGAKPFRVEGGVNSVNENIRKNKWDLAEYDPNHNVNTLVDEMRKQGVKIVPVYIDGGLAARKTATGEQQPWLTAHIGDTQWQQAQAMKQYYKPSEGGAPKVKMSENQAVQEANDKPSLENNTRAVAAIAEKRYIDPETELATLPNTHEKIIVQEELRFFKDTLRGNENLIQNKINERYGPIVGEERAKDIITNKDSITVRDFGRILYDGVKSKKTNPETEITYKGAFIPFFKDNSAILPSYFAEVSIVGKGPKRVEKLPAVTVVKPLTEDVGVIGAQKGMSPEEKRAYEEFEATRTAQVAIEDADARISSLEVQTKRRTPTPIKEGQEVVFETTDDYGMPGVSKGVIERVDKDSVLISGKNILKQDILPTTEPLTKDVGTIEVPKPKVKETLQDQKKNILQERIKKVKEEAGIIYGDLYNRAITSIEELSYIRDKQSYAKRVNGILSSIESKKSKNLTEEQYKNIKKSVEDSVKARVLSDMEDAFKDADKLRFENVTNERARKHIIEIENKRLLGMNVKKGESDFLSKYYKENQIGEGTDYVVKQSITLKGKNLFERSKDVEERYKGNPKKIQEEKDKIFTQSSKERKTEYERNLSEPTDSYAYGYAKTYLDGLKYMFGEKQNKWFERWDLNSFFDPSTVKGKSLLESSSKQLNEQGYPISQPKEVVKRLNEMLQKKKYGELTKKDKEYIYGERTAEATKIAEKKAYKKPTEEEKEYLESGYSIQGIEQGAQKNITDLTISESRNIGKLLKDLNIQPNAVNGMRDAYNDLRSLIQSFNASIKKDSKKKKVFFKDEDYNKIEKEIRSAIKEGERKKVLEIKQPSGEALEKYDTLKRSVESMERLEKSGDLPLDVYETLQKNKKILESMSKNIKKSPT